MSEYKGGYTGGKPAAQMGPPATLPVEMFQGPMGDQAVVYPTAQQALIDEVINRVLLYRAAGMKADQHIGFLTDPAGKMAPGPQSDDTKLAIKAEHLNALVDEVQQLRRKVDDLRSRNDVLTTIAVRSDQVRELHRPVRVCVEREIDAGTERVTLFSVCRECQENLVEDLYDGKIPSAGIPFETHSPCHTIKVLDGEDQ